MQSSGAQPGSFSDIQGVVKSMRRSVCESCLLPSGCTPVGLGFKGLEMAM